MKAKLSKFITIGIMLLILALIISHYPEIPKPASAQNTHKPTTMSNLIISTPNKQLRAN